MKKKRSIIAKSVIAATVATSVFAVTNTANAASVSQAEKAVVKAEKLAGALKWETSIEYRKVKYPKNVVGYPNMKLHNETKQALADARKAVSTLKGKEKTILSARLDANVATYVNRSVAYIDAVSSGLKIQKVYNQLHAQYAKGVVDDQTAKLYNQLSYEIKKNAKMLDRVYGVTTRNQFRSYYKQTAEKQLADLVYPMTIKVEIDRASAALKTGDTETAAKRLGNVDYFVKAAAAKGLKANNKLIVSAQSKLKTVQAEFNQKAVLYIVNSTNPAAPTTFGPATGTETVNKTVYLYAGVNQHLKLQNQSISGNLVVLGSPAGAGSVSLDGVKVSGKLIVEDVADHTLILNNCNIVVIVVNDSNGASIVSGPNNVIGQVTTNAKGELVLSGDLSNTSIVVVGSAHIAVAAGAKVGEVVFTGSGTPTMSVAAGATVQTVKADTSFTGKASVDNSGTIQQADSSIPVSGTPANETTNPPAGGGGGGGVVTPALAKVVALEGTQEVALDQLVSAPGTAAFTGVKITTSNATQFAVTSVSVGSTQLPIPSHNVFNIVNNITTITTSDLLGYPSVSMNTLRTLFGGQTITIKGTLDSKTEVTISFKLENSTDALASTFTNSYGTITRNGTDFQVTASSIFNHNAPLASITAPDGTTFVSHFLTFNTDNTPVDQSVVDLAKSLISTVLGKSWTEVTYNDLVNHGTFSQYGYTVKFI